MMQNSHRFKENSKTGLFYRVIEYLTERFALLINLHNETGDNN